MHAIFTLPARKYSANENVPENDQLFPDDVRIAGQKYLEENKVEHEIKVYPGVPHGKSYVGEQARIMIWL